MAPISLGSFMQSSSVIPGERAARDPGSITTRFAVGVPGSSSLRSAARDDSASARYHTRYAQHQIGELFRRIERAGRFCAGRHGGKFVGIGGIGKGGNLASKPRRRELVLLEHDGAARLGKHVRIRELVLIERVGQR